VVGEVNMIKHEKDKELAALMLIGVSITLRVQSVIALIAAVVAVIVARDAVWTWAILFTLWALMLLGSLGATWLARAIARS
jgi:uncharacterized membrane protein YqjE